jgi:hypothetical protein
MDPIKNKKGDWESRMSIPGATPDMRIADSMEQIAGYMDQIKQMLQDLSVRPDVDNAQLQQIAIAVEEIQRIVPILLMR